MNSVRLIDKIQNSHPLLCGLRQGPLYTVYSTVYALPPPLCSAGVGRTGTFITIDVCLNQVEGESNLDIFNYVRHMRFRRNYMVQTAVSYG